MYQRLVIGGTGASQALCEIYYYKIAKTLNAQIVSLPNLGLTDPRGSIAMLEDIAAINGCIDLIGHSQGGLLAAMFACRHPAQVNKIITLGAPLKGTPLANNGIKISFIQCMSNSNKDLKDLYGYPAMLNIASKLDIFIPTKNALLDGANHLVVNWPGHILMPQDNKIIKAVEEFLDG